MTSPRIHLHITPGQARALFDRVIQGAHSPSQALAGLNALALLLGSHVDEGDRQGDGYRQIREQLSLRLDQAREQLLAEQASVLTGALAVFTPTGIAQVHSILSREAFFQAVERSVRNLSAPELEALHIPVRQWCTDAERRARDASPYPDALNWEAAGIAAADYLAMQDLHTALNLIAADRNHQ
jgi:hypothetical protein